MLRITRARWLTGSLHTRSASRSVGRSVAMPPRDRSGGGASGRRLPLSCREAHAHHSGSRSVRNRRARPTPERSLNRVPIDFVIATGMGCENSSSAVICAVMRDTASRRESDTRVSRPGLFAGLCLLSMGFGQAVDAQPAARLSGSSLISANDNRSPAGTLANGVLTLDSSPSGALAARGPDGRTLSVQAFGKRPARCQSPGPSSACPRERKSTLSSAMGSPARHSCLRTARAVHARRRRARNPCG